MVIINESMAQQFAKYGSDPLNERLIINKGVMHEFDAEPVRQIIGIVADTRDTGLNRDPGPMMFMPQAQQPDAVNAINVRIAPMAWIVRTRIDPSRVSEQIQDEIRRTAALPVSDVQTMDDIAAHSTSRQQFHMLLMSVFGGAALALAAIGIYGVMAYSVAQQTQEIGIRLALGADRSMVQRAVVGQGLWLAVCGIAAGLVVERCALDVHGQLSFRGEAAGPPDVFGHADDAHCRRAIRGLAARPARVPRRPCHRAAVVVAAPNHKACRGLSSDLIDQSCQRRKHGVELDPPS